MYRDLARRQRAITVKNDTPKPRHVPKEKQKWVPKRCLQCNVAHMSDVRGVPRFQCNGTNVPLSSCLSSSIH
ncbi:hypothetical protein Syun_028869 [Stephania yunnanensis]|uniref:Uncharacterized protein n=1 Tax=Stephania yunnanensis TaxID=152371 RepID=A0AAP0HKV2_9MAGN